MADTRLEAKPGSSTPKPNYSPSSAQGVGKKNGKPPKHINGGGVREEVMAHYQASAKKNKLLSKLLAL